MKLTTVKDKVGEARAKALKDAKREFDFRYFPSRGVNLCTSNAHGDQCGPNPDAECPSWDGNKASIVKLVEKVKAQHPGVARVYLSGGYDGADSPVAYRDGDYTPWAGSWAVDLWSAEQGWLV